MGKLTDTKDPPLLALNARVQPRPPQPGVALSLLSAVGWGGLALADVASLIGWGLKKVDQKWQAEVVD